MCPGKQRPQNRDGQAATLTAHDSDRPVLWGVRSWSTSAAALAARELSTRHIHQSMNSLLDPRARASLDARLANLRSDTARHWGRMTASQMVCHLTDAFRGSMGELGEANAQRRTTLFGRTIMKWWALYLPWPHGVRTARRADQERDGTRPTTFESDLATLKDATDRFVRELPALSRRSHFFFGHLSEAQWARWGYQHIDHHLRQFGL